jgi:hypothetical protein
MKEKLARYITLQYFRTPEAKTRTIDYIYDILKLPIPDEINKIFKKQRCKNFK